MCECLTLSCSNKGSQLAGFSLGLSAPFQFFAYKRRPFLLIDFSPTMSSNASALVPAASASSSGKLRESATMVSLFSPSPLTAAHGQGQVDAREQRAFHGGRTLVVLQPRLLSLPNLAEFPPDVSSKVRLSLHEGRRLDQSLARAANLRQFRQGSGMVASSGGAVLLGRRGKFHRCSGGNGGRI